MVPLSDRWGDRMSQPETDEPIPPPPPHLRQRRVTFKEESQESTQGPPQVSIPGPDRLRTPVEQLRQGLGATVQAIVVWTERTDGSSHAAGTSENLPSWNIGGWESGTQRNNTDSWFHDS